MADYKTKSQRLENEIAEYKKECEKIPSICNYLRDELGSWDYLQCNPKGCKMKICPKYKEV